MRRATLWVGTKIPLPAMPHLTQLTEPSSRWNVSVLADGREIPDIPLPAGGYEDPHWPPGVWVSDQVETPEAFNLQLRYLLLVPTLVLIGLLFLFPAQFSPISVFGLLLAWFMVVGGIGYYIGRYSLAGARGSSELQPDAAAPSASDFEKLIRGCCTALGETAEKWDGSVWCAGTWSGDQTLFFETDHRIRTYQKPRTPVRIAVVSRGASRLDFHQRVKGLLIEASATGWKVPGRSSAPKTARVVEQPVTAPNEH